tara:strand:+ start:800 stop:961 length:162 start_codon:yes stop_codon:yes gene_type:complete
MRGFKNKKGMFTLARWFNLLVGLKYVQIYTLEDNIYMLILGSINIGVWALTRK